MQRINVKLGTRIGTIVAAALLAMIIISICSLVQLRHSMQEERRASLSHLLDSSRAQLDYLHLLETRGSLTRTQAQDQAMRLIAAQTQGDRYFFVRTLNDDRLLYHPIASRIGKLDNGGMLDNGRSAAQTLRDGLAASLDGKAFAVTMNAHPGNRDTQRFPKLNGVTRFAPWGWMLGTGFFIDDIDRAFWRSASLFVLICAVLTLGVVALAWHAIRQVMRQLGCEPAHAAQIALAIAASDLSRTLVNTGDPQSLLGSMCAMQQNLHGMVMHFNSASSTLQVAAQKLNEDTRQFRLRSQQVTDTTASTAAAVEQMSVSIAHVSASARETETRSRLAVDLAGAGEKLVGDASADIAGIADDIAAAVGLIRGLVQRASEIDTMSAEIRDIADQTNLLALNAAIEAARAGEQGRGFAVVADEVRKLAERSGMATLNITDTIRSIRQDTDIAAAQMDGVQRQITHGVELTQEAARALRDIDQGARLTLESTRDVASAAQEQAQVSDDIARNIERIANMVDESDATICATHAQVQQLYALAHDLNQTAGAFRL